MRFFSLLFIGVLACDEEKTKTEGTETVPLDVDADGFDEETDCDDQDPEINPGVEEVCDGIDNDCDGEIDEAVLTSFYADSDGDGFGNPEMQIDACEVPNGFVSNGSDCDDTNDITYPSAEEICDGEDNNCDGDTDEGLMETHYVDADEDGYVADTSGGSDCDDTESTINPGATETYYDGVDSDCSGGSDYDADGDGYDSDAYSGTDCDDTEAAINPGATETYYDGVDTDCSGGSDYDADGDGYDSDAYSGTDCDDTTSAISPGVSEIWYDGTDQNCDGESDYDRDGDGEDSTSFSGADCDDGNASVNSTASEILDGLDNDCDTYCDEGLLSAGDLVISEFLKDPSVVSDSVGEWLEIYNATSTDITICEGWTLFDDDLDSVNIASDVLIEAGSYVVMGKNDDSSLNGGVTLDYEYGSAFTLANGADEIVLEFADPVDGTYEMSRVDYLDRPTWPDTAGKSISLDPDFMDETSNDDVSNWCHGTTTFGSGDVGTPGALNDEC